MGTNILLVEDLAETAELIAEELESSPDGFAVISANSASEAHTILGGHDVDCVVLDYDLPDARGLRCLADIHRFHPQIPVVLITCVGSEHIAKEAIRIGASDYVAKDGLYIERLLLAIREALGRRYLSSTNGSRSSAALSTTRLASEPLSGDGKAGITGNGNGKTIEQVQVNAQGPAVASDNPEARGDRLEKLRDMVAAFERAVILERLLRFGYRRAATARSLGISTVGLWKKCRKLRIKLPRDPGNR